MSYRVHAWWDHPGEAEPGEDDLGEGWARCRETVTIDDPAVVASYLRGHPDAQGADLDELDLAGDVVGRFIAERTIAGWIMSLGPKTP